MILSIVKDYRLKRYCSSHVTACLRHLTAQLACNSSDKSSAVSKYYKFMNTITFTACHACDCRLDAYDGTAILRE
jgi:hypothetical protein